MNRAARRAEIKGNKTNSRREGEKNMKGMNAVSEVSIERVKEIYKQLEEPFGLLRNVELPDEVVEAKYNEVKSTGIAKRFIKNIVIKSDFVSTMVDITFEVFKSEGYLKIYSNRKLMENAYLVVGLYIAVSVTILQENYAEGMLLEIISEVREYELDEAAEERMDKICTLVMPEEEVQAIKTFQALLSGDAQSFVNELDRFEAMLGIQK